MSYLANYILPHCMSDLHLPQNIDASLQNNTTVIFIAQNIRIN